MSDIKDIVESPSLTTSSGLNTISEISLKRYEETYNTFLAWQKSKGILTYTENILLAYFEEQSKKYKPSTLKTHYSMLRITLYQHHKININDYNRLSAYLKKISKGYQTKKISACTFTPKEIDIFVNSAPDKTHLLTKVKFIDFKFYKR